MEKMNKEHFSHSDSEIRGASGEMAKIKGDDLVKYITERAVTYIDMPKDIRRQYRQERRIKKRELHWSYRWFGMLPFSLGLWYRQKKTILASWRKSRADGK
ncbi:MAG: hypothetical protein K0R57_2879 [Paenibacillaceae bacterium]|jgi:hypothetical protein|nr:hypothetical protein [Paenibacillaceae bacterium]